ncbi:catalase [Corynebacterium sp. HMSC28B08]|uniref:catalase n=1 Tax=Corynebacterium sp. HMSC28B08 TaxID=1581066 RepID=UPI0008A1D167|nr:catalase [Corynebacterium sp. HMSC28B08]OFT88971.1 catalase HPII [Corynebacterium sp. HMSC28B08]
MSSSTPSPKENDKNVDTTGIAPSPSGHTPEVQEPTTPVDPPQPNSDQGSPEPRSATGCPFHIGAGEADPRHQQGQYMTNSQGARITTADHSLRAGERGPVLIQDHQLRDKLQHFDHERIPERVVHARGAGAHGTFVSNGKGAEICRARVFDKGEETPVFVRFSTVAGFRGSMDTARDTRGFATKFYTAEGNWDLVGNNIPVFFIQDGMKFPDVVHSVKPEPDLEIPQAQSAHDTFWDFVTLHTEATHHTMWNMSDRGIPRSFRMMEGFGIHTFRVTNQDGKTHLVKFHWKPRLGVHSLIWEEAQLAGGFDPDFHRRDLSDAIKAGAYPEWDLGVQVFEDTEDEMFEGIDLLDPTKLVPEELAPVTIIGTMTLNANPTNYFAETEQATFHPGVLPPGINVTADPLLQGRLFSYSDTQLNRLGGPNHGQLPINRPHAQVNDNQRDGRAQQAIHTGKTAYSPNSLEANNPLPAEEKFTRADDNIGTFVDPEVIVAKSTQTRRKPVSFEDHYTQPAMFYRSLTETEQQHLISAYTFELSKCYETPIRQRAVDVLARVDRGLADAVAEGLGLQVSADAPAEVGSVETSPALSQLGKTYPVDGRKVAILADDSTPAEAIQPAVQAIVDAGMTPLVAATTGGALAAGDSTGQDVPVSRTYTAARSIEFDAAIVISLPDTPETNTLVEELTLHLKAIAVLDNVQPAEGQHALRKLVENTPAGVQLVADAKAGVDALVPLMENHRVWERA